MTDDKPTDIENPTPSPPRPLPVRPGRIRSFLSRLGRIRWRRRTSAGEQEARKLPPMSRGVRRFSMIAFFISGALVTWFVVGNPLEVEFFPARPSVTTPVATEEQESGGALYQCSMHVHVVEDEPSDCPICGMALVEVASYSAGPGTAPSTSSSGERQVLYWYAPMDATYIRDEPGLSPTGMKLVPKYADELEGSKEGVIRIDPVQVQNIGVVSVEAELKDITRYSRTVGILDFNAERIVWVNTKFEGWIEKVHVNYVGQTVRKAQPLFEIYSPALVTTQEEYLRALQYRASLEGSGRPNTIQQAESLVQSTRDRLLYWDISNEQIQALEASQEVQRLLTVGSPAEGVVAEIMSEALEGMYVKPGMNLYRIADLSTVWVHADIFEVDIPWIDEGQPAFVSFHNDPDAQFHGHILFLYPEVSRDTRALKICVEVPNPDRRLRPGMYADVVVQGPPVRDAVVIPQSAVIHSGERNIVFLDLGGGKFDPREVELGVKGEDDRIQIVKGVAPGQKVVTQAQFMLDSESRIQEAIAKFRQRSNSAGQNKNEPPSPAQVP